VFKQYFRDVTSFFSTSLASCGFFWHGSKKTSCAILHLVCTILGKWTSFYTIVEIQNLRLSLVSEENNMINIKSFVEHFFIDVWKTTNVYI